MNANFLWYWVFLTHRFLIFVISGACNGCWRKCLFAACVCNSHRPIVFKTKNFYTVSLRTFLLYMQTFKIFTLQQTCWSNMRSKIMPDHACRCADVWEPPYWDPYCLSDQPIQKNFPSTVQLNNVNKAEANVIVWFIIVYISYFPHCFLIVFFFFTIHVHHLLSHCELCINGHHRLCI